ncbi:BadF/BadG/BcrA/BcrD ATPase family protein [Marivita sp.]|uniref:BadF/BadG/BcrA/BcrD ATPase family protein n=1 Tax=Marivita sp. TaxID=2003365 RepID=UPI003F70325D
MDTAQTAKICAKAAHMTSASRYIIGIDGGGTGCRVAIHDVHGRLIGTASGGAANYTSDPEATLQNITETLSCAAVSAGLSMDALMSAPAHLGIAGIVTAHDAQAAEALLPLQYCKVSNDQMISVVGALGDRNGAVVSVGTGSFVAIKRNTEVRYLGGWGLQLGDQASGAWLGRMALQRAALVLDDLKETSDAIETLLAQFDRDAAALIAFARHATPAAYAALAQTLFSASDNDDPNALALVKEGADYLNLCLRRSHLTGDDVVCLTGSLGPRYAPFLETPHKPRLAEPHGTALDGALRLARQMADLI